MGPTSDEAKVETLQRLLAAFNAHDLDAVMSFFAEDCVLDTPRGPKPWGQRFQGWDQVREGLAGRFAGIPDVRYGDDRHWVVGDRGCSEWLLTGTSTAGEMLEVRGCDLIEFRDGEIVRKDSYWKIVDPELKFPPRPFSWPPTGGSTATGGGIRKDSALGTTSADGA